MSLDYFYLHFKVRGFIKERILRPTSKFALFQVPTVLICQMLTLVFFSGIEF